MESLQTAVNLAGVGASWLEDPFLAGEEAVKKALAGIERREVGLALVFSSVKYDPYRLLEGVKSVLGSAVQLAGCTTAGEISNVGPQEKSVVVMVLSSDAVRAGVGVGRNVKGRPREAGREAILGAIKNLGLSVLGLIPVSLEQRVVGYNPFFVLTFPDGLSCMEEEVMEGIKSVIGTHFPIIGGSAGDDLKLDKTFQFCNGDVFTDSVVCSIVSTNLSVGFSSKHGWKPLDKFALVTKSSERVVKQFNSRDAAEVYAEMLGTTVEELRKGTLAWEKGLTHPLGMPDIFGEYWLRHPQKIVNGAISFFSRVPEGVALRLMEGDKNSLAQAGKRAVEVAFANAGEPKEIVAVMIFNCVARRLLLKADGAKEELMGVKEIVGNTPIIGFYTYGEQGFTKGGPPGHRNQTITMCLIGR